MDEQTTEQRIEANLREAFRREASGEPAEADIEEIRRRANRETGIRDVVAFGFARMILSFLSVFARLHNRSGR